MERRLIPVTRAVTARLVPTGDPLEIPAGVFVSLTQSLGGTYTVLHEGNMARIDGEDADALGFEQETLDFATPQPGDTRISPDNVNTALASVFDPEIPVSIVDLGLVYSTHIDDLENKVCVTMTLTAPGCGMGEVLVRDVEQRLLRVPNVQAVNVELVFDPAWNRDMMSEEAQLTLGLF